MSTPGESIRVRDMPLEGHAIIHIPVDEDHS